MPTKRPTEPRARRLPPLALSVQYPDGQSGAPSRTDVRRWVRAACTLPAEVTVRVVDAAEGRMLNRDYRGRDCAIALPRAQKLTDGAVLYCRDGMAIVARIDGGARLRLVPHSLGDALRLGHWCGNLHWKVVFGEGWMDVILDGPEARYRDRLRDLATLARFDIG